MILKEERKFRIKLNISSKENVDTLRSMKKDIRFKVLIRESKINNSLDYFIEKLNDKNIDTEEINKVQSSVSYLKKESKDIREFRQSFINEFGYAH